ncbi:hypothetical protein [Telmatospirillum sp.]|uniref:hypothetical protein n=1 Tax=Telmatospirillum sp. TaxID=2079197 RepID=UPI00284495D3|nr:hypothetical protein [Telmatospirillum sp.]MDR3438074.1 hypothetical protein [Telmatospirillum sp.]
MSNYHLSLLRSKGWMRAGFVVAILMIPLASMGFALGYFNEGWLGFTQAAEFVASGASAALIVGASAGWILRGFAVRNREDEEEKEENRSPARPAGPATAPPGARHAGPPTAGRH